MILFAFYLSLLGSIHAVRVRPPLGGEAGFIVDTVSGEGKSIRSCVPVAVSGLNRDNQMRKVLHTRDSKGDSLHALSAELSSVDKVGRVILREQTSSLEAKYLAQAPRFNHGSTTSEIVGSWSHGSTHGRRLLSSSSNGRDLGTIIWPRRGTSTISRGRMMQTSSKVLRIGVPVTNGFPQLLKVDRDLHTNVTIVSGFCIDVFRAAVDGLKYQIAYQFVPFEYTNPNIGEAYDDLVYQVYLQKFDAVVGDITITANRSLYVDFTLPYTDMGVGMVTQLTPKDSRNLWIFLKPLTGGLWLMIVGVYVFTATVIWLIERPSFVEQTPQPNRQIERMFRFSFSILVFANWDKLSSNLSRAVVLLWVFVVFILGSNYTATLTSMMTVQQIELNSKISRVGYRVGPVTQEVVGNLNFKNSSSTSPWLTSPEEFENALSEGSKSGGFSAIIDELPYINIFLEKYRPHYSMIGPVMPTTNGFGFAFPKGSAMAVDISKEIAKLREDGRLQVIENAWFKSPTTGFDSGDGSGSVNPLTVGDFRGLFLISGSFTALAFMLFFASLLYKNLSIMRRWGRPEIVKQYICMRILKRRRDTNVIYPEVEVDNV
ncbi:hypothetical protein GQ457_11G004020 [Hibiscus cannabinus]